MNVNAVFCCRGGAEDMQWSLHRSSSLPNSTEVFWNLENGRPSAAYAIEEREGEDEKDEEEEKKEDRERDDDDNDDEE